MNSKPPKQKDLMALNIMSQRTLVIFCHVKVDMYVLLQGKKMEMGVVL